MGPLAVVRGYLRASPASTGHPRTTRASWRRGYEKGELVIEPIEPTFFHVSAPPKPQKMWANRQMRLLLLITGATGVVNVGIQLISSDPGAALAVAWGYAFAFWTAITGYNTGTGTRRIIGRWIGYPVDADGTPTAPPLTGQILADPPERLSRKKRS